MLKSRKIFHFPTGDEMASLQNHLSWFDPLYLGQSTICRIGSPLWKRKYGQNWKLPQHFLFLYEGRKFHYPGKQGRNFVGALYWINLSLTKTHCTVRTSLISVYFFLLPARHELFPCPEAGMRGGEDFFKYLAFPALTKSMQMKNLCFCKVLLS